MFGLIHERVERRRRPDLAAADVQPDEPPVSPDGSNEFRTAWITDPDGNRIELVQWPPGHPDGMTAADFSDA